MPYYDHCLAPFPDLKDKSGHFASCLTAALQSIRRSIVLNRSAQQVLSYFQQKTLSEHRSGGLSLTIATFCHFRRFCGLPVLASVAAGIAALAG